MANEYFSTKSYLVSMKEKTVLPIAFKSAIEAFDYARDHNLTQLGYNMVMKGGDVRRLLGSQRISEPKEVDTSGENGKMPQEATMVMPAVSDLTMREFRRELRKQPARKLEEAYIKLKKRKPTGIPIVDKHRIDNFNLALLALNEALWERGMLPRGELKMVPQVLGSKFPLGQLVMTRGVADKVATDAAFAGFALESLKRHANGDWGDLCEEDKKENEYALNKRLRLFSAYDKYPTPKIWIITEADRSVTTTLFPEEY